MSSEIEHHHEANSNVSKIFEVTFTYKISASVTVEAVSAKEAESYARNNLFHSLDLDSHDVWESKIEITVDQIEDLGEASK